MHNKHKHSQIRFYLKIFIYKKTRSLMELKKKIRKKNSETLSLKNHSYLSLILNSIYIYCTKKRKKIQINYNIIQSLKC